MQTKKSQQYLIVSRKVADDSPTPEADVIVDRDALLRSYFEGTAANSHLATELLVPPTQAFYTTADGHRANALLAQQVFARFAKSKNEL